jgi:DNA repair exonuclease SbcCD nuclease subunit
VEPKAENPDNIKERDASLLKIEEPDLALRKKVRLVHTSDLHLGNDWHHQWSCEALQGVVEAVPRLGGDVLLLVGDVFDHSRVPDSVLEFFLKQVSRLPTPAVVLPGNHDLYDNHSIYRREPFRRKPENLHIFTQLEGQIIRFPHLTLELWGRTMQAHTPEFRPLVGMPASDNGHWLVALAHGHFHFGYDKEVRSSPIFPWEIAEASCDYLALGHWDRHVDVSQGRVKAVYSGAPLSPFHRGQMGAVTVVDLDPLRGVETQQALLNSLSGFHIQEVLT